MSRGWLAVVLFAATFVIGGAATAGTASACSCARVTDDEAFGAAEAVFVGELVEVRGPTVMISSSAESRFVFAVVEVFKGEVFETQSIVSASDGASCGLELPTATPVVVFAGGWESEQTADPGEYVSSLCSGSRRLSVAPVPASFGGGSPPRPGSSPIGQDDALASEIARWWYWIAAGAAAVGVGVVMVLKARRRTD